MTHSLKTNKNNRDYSGGFLIIVIQPPIFSSVIPELDDTFRENSVLVHPNNKERSTVRFDAEKVVWVKKQDEAIKPEWTLFEWHKSRFRASYGLCMECIA